MEDGAAERRRCSGYRRGFGAGPRAVEATKNGAVAQLGERLLCKQEAVGSIPSSSTKVGVQCEGSEGG
jgi:hypothetical protein